ncbi:hypothetical protein [Enterococcus rivorum]|uniref:Uncharacterized protein n=1 Tax=Enterococcus rivorum TaxID=762845 RepID=A0A1E5L0M5_9ENTE|nr:hypothetical protein [Enterococcus rivorum]MBP2098896.1 hypothetical protein [Enterococcus rivorum]OEH83621.1 hypothetical protein BCR26_09090 [Enterococcus rivorum]
MIVRKTIWKIVECEDEGNPIVGLVTALPISVATKEQGLELPGLKEAEMESEHCYSTVRDMPRHTLKSVSSVYSALTELGERLL